MHFSHVTVGALSQQERVGVRGGGVAAPPIKAEGPSHTGRGRHATVVCPTHSLRLVHHGRLGRAPAARYPSQLGPEPENMTVDKNQRALETGIHTDLSGRLSYGGYL